MTWRIYQQLHNLYIYCITLHLIIIQNMNIFYMGGGVQDFKKGAWGWVGGLPGSPPPDPPLMPCDLLL